VAIRRLGKHGKHELVVVRCIGVGDGAHTFLDIFIFLCIQSSPEMSQSTLFIHKYTFSSTYQFGRQEIAAQ
jgi:hypothetical protein